MTNPYIESDSVSFSVNQFIGTFGSVQITESASKVVYPIVGLESIMSQKANGSTQEPVQQKLKWNCDREKAVQICCYNRHYAEHSGYWKKTTFLEEVDKKNPTTFYDPVTGKPLFILTLKNRTFKDFKVESEAHGWPSVELFCVL